MGLKKLTQKIWTQDEIDLLTKLFPHKENQQVAKKLNRSVSSILGKAYKIGLKKSSRREGWEKTEINLLKKSFSFKNRQKVADKLGRSVSSVLGKGYALGLKKRKKAIRSSSRK